MIVVIQCASTKTPGAGRMRTALNKPVVFVANPQAAPQNADVLYACPDDPSDTGPSWRELLQQYNNASQGNPLGLYQAYQLYANAAYRRLVDTLGANRVYILSAGWGLLSSDFLTPDYNITFSNSAESFTRRRPNDFFCDFKMLPEGTTEDVVFFGGQAYLPSFCKLTQHTAARRIVVYNSNNRPVAARCALVRYDTRTRTNWHYEAVNAFIGGRFQIEA